MKRPSPACLTPIPVKPTSKATSSTRNASAPLTATSIALPVKWAPPRGLPYSSGFFASTGCVICRYPDDIVTGLPNFVRISCSRSIVSSTMFFRYAYRQVRQT